VSFILATVFFAFQIYCDFSGYSDIAIGTAQVMGFKLMENFKRPYFSKSISEFWRRWHISLSSWFRDYLYIPLGGNRVTRSRWFFNLFVVFLISGLWHGANWTFLVWGGLHGLYLTGEIVSTSLRRKVVSVLKLETNLAVLKLLRIGITFFLVCFAWIFFRANSISEAFYIIRHLFSGVWNYLLNVLQLKHDIVLWDSILIGQRKEEFLIALAAIGCMEFIHLLQRHYSIRQMLRKQPFLFRWAVYLIAVNTIIYFGIFNKNVFIYFQF
jgi:D-alanyl-lipoteichoic acid acyltransferase DltB (MBOAT superfamily)